MLSAHSRECGGQFLKGISVGFSGLERANAVQLAEAFKKGVEYAYKSVLKPTEGTILTVMREAAEYAGTKVDDSYDISSYIEDFIVEAKKSLKRTPELLPVLKKAGVVDSGAAGLICIIDGFGKVARGEELVADGSLLGDTTQKMGHFDANSVLEYGYCTEFILQLMHAKTNIAQFDLSVITDFLETVGDSIVAIHDEDTVKVHVHTMTPGKVVEFCQQFGEFVTFKMENMSVQHSEAMPNAEVLATEANEEKKQFALVAVACGEGLTKTFLDLGADRIIPGGQTMNPSSEDFVNAFKTVNAENIFVLPNNSNIIMAAQQAAQLYTEANVVVVNTSTIAEGYAALSLYDTTSCDTKTIAEGLESASKNVDTLSVTYAVRDGNIDGITFEKGDFICISDKKILSAAKDKVVTAVDGIKNFDGIADKEIITVIFGKDASESDREQLVKQLEREFPDFEIFEMDGGQEVYSYTIAIE